MKRMDVVSLLNQIFVPVQRGERHYRHLADHALAPSDRAFFIACWQKYTQCLVELENCIRSHGGASSAHSPVDSMFNDTIDDAEALHAYSLAMTKSAPFDIQKLLRRHHAICQDIATTQFLAPKPA